MKETLADRYLWAFNPYARLMSGRPAETDETRRLQALPVQGTGPDLDANRAEIQKFIDREFDKKNRT